MDNTYKMSQYGSLDNFRIPRRMDYFAAHRRPVSDYMFLWERKLSELMELMSRTTLETHKLDMMAEVSSLKVKLSTTEKCKREVEEKLKAAQRHILDLEAHMASYNADHRRAQRNGMTSPALDSSGEGSNSNNNVEREKTLDRLKRKQTEVEKLKRVVDSLVLSNDEKDKQLGDLHRMVQRYKKVEDYVIQSQGRKLIDEILSGDEESSAGSLTPSTGYDSAARDTSQVFSTNSYHKPAYLSSPNATSTPVSTVSPDQKSRTLSRSHDNETPRKRPIVGLVRSNSCEDVSQYPPKTPPNLKRNHTTTESSRDYAHAVDTSDGYQRTGHRGNTPPGTKKTRGLKRLFGKLRRSSSTDLDDDNYHEDFKRGGIRATAGARLGWSRDLKTNDDFSQHFSRWDCDKVMAWLYNIGLNMYVIDCKRWIKNGDQLLRATPNQLEKELNIKNPLHKKKLQLALQAVTSGQSDQFKTLDHNWVTGWLDDIGLPQYKEAFHDARVDGRMLNQLTVDDLLWLKVTNSLHHMSIRQGIHVLRSNYFSTACLKRRPSPDEVTRNVPDDVCLWTNHRVMEWLRTIDLSEYAPNLRGSGVHGALMVMEPKFTAELFSLVLSIPQNKTLLRRHLKTHFISLIGNDVQHKKREMEASPHYVPLLPNSKVKLQRKFGLFSHKRSKSENEYDDYVCPPESMGTLKLANGSSGQHNGHPLPVTVQTDPKTTKEIGVVSKEIKSMTTRLRNDKFIDTVQTSTV